MILVLSAFLLLTQESKCGCQIKYIKKMQCRHLDQVLSQKQSIIC